MLDMWIVILTLLLKAASLWFLAVALFALRKPKSYAVCAPRTRFACLVAARNEEAVIGALVESLKKQDYPDALYDIFVIPNNCTDDTESEALCAGAKIFRCFEPVRCKGDALHEAVAWLLPQRYDAFCVFDADNIADEQFLARMNDAFCAGAQVCKGAMRAKNPYDSWLSGCYGLYFTLFDTFFSRARMSCGLSSKLVGTGFAVHRAVLERFGGWNTSTIAEDAEFAAQCAANGVRVCFVPGALTYDEAPNDFAVSLRQRRRWCSGIMDVAVRMDAPLVSALRGSAPLRALDALLIVNAPFLQALDIILDKVAEIKKRFDYDIKELNLGGGFGATYIDEERKPYAYFLAPMMERIEAFFTELGVERPAVVIEPGRSIVAEAGLSLYTIGSIKDIRDIRKYVSVDGGMTDNIRPALYQAEYEGLVANKASEPKDDKVTICGKCCESGDILIKDCMITGTAKAGDLFAMFSTGAYGFSMASNYNSNPIPAVVLVKDGKSELIVKRQSYDDMIKNQLMPEMLK